MICDYVLAEQTDINIRESTKEGKIKVLDEPNSKERVTPRCIQGIKKLPRQERSPYNTPTCGRLVNMRYVRLPEHNFDQSPGHSIVAKKQGYYYCRLHPEIKNGRRNRYNIISNTKSLRHQIRAFL